MSPILIVAKFIDQEKTRIFCEVDGEFQIDDTLTGSDIN